MRTAVTVLISFATLLGAMTMTSCGDKRQNESVRTPLERCQNDYTHWDDRRRCLHSSYQEEIDRCTRLHRDNRTELDRCYRDVRRRFNTVDSSFDDFNRWGGHHHWDNRFGGHHGFYDPYHDPFYNTEFWPTVYNPNIAIQPRDPWAAYWQQAQAQQAFYNQLYRTYGSGFYAW